MLTAFVLFEAACAAGLLAVLGKEGRLRFRRRSAEAALPPARVSDGETEKLAA